jgi:hypothetical protein
MKSNYILLALSSTIKADDGYLLWLRYDGGETPEYYILKHFQRDLFLPDWRNCRKHLNIIRN